MVLLVNTRLVVLRPVPSRVATLTRVMRSPGSAARRPVTWLPGSREAVTTAATTTDPAVTTTDPAAATTALPLLGLLLSRARVAITAMEPKLDMLRRAPLLVLPPVLHLGSNRRLLVAKLLTGTEDTEDTPILLAWLLPLPLRACLRWLTAALLPRRPLATNLLPLLLAISLLLPLPAISLPRPRLRREQFGSCHWFHCEEKL